jgi:hypothetical protein
MRWLSQEPGANVDVGLAFNINARSLSGQFMAPLRLQEGLVRTFAGLSAAARDNIEKGKPR